LGKLSKAEQYKKYNDERKRLYKELRDKGYSPAQARELRTKVKDVKDVEKLNVKSTPVKDSYKRQPKKSYYSKREKANRDRRKRYQVYRDMGYSPKESNNMSNKKSAIDVSKIRMGRDGKIKKGKVYEETKEALIVNRYKDNNYKRLKIKQVNNKPVSPVNDSVYSVWGFLTQVEPYNDDTERTAKYLMDKRNLSNEQAHWILYYMIQHDQDYETAKNELLSNIEYEKYDSSKKGVK